MDSNGGGLSSEERQRQTAAEIARRKVLQAYSQTAAGQDDVTNDSNSSYKNTPVTQNIDKESWEKYHSAWQNYYQKYYSDYYAKAAKQYIDTEKLKADRARAEVEAEQEKNVDSEIEEHIKDSLRETIRKKADSRFHVKKKHRKLIPIFAGVFVILLLLFLQYNRLIFAPIAAYIAPGTTTDSGITAVDPTVATAVSDTNKLLIPKINVDVPAWFGIPLSEVDADMRKGVAQYVISGASAMPGEYGRIIITGHSAGDVYSNNQYKYIFSGLERLVEGDLIYIDYNKARYTYKVTGSEIIEPTDVNKVAYSGNKKTLALITCTPLGTSLHRLVVHAEQISPAYDEMDEADTDDKTKTTTETTNNDSDLPSNEATFFERVWTAITNFFSSIWKWLTGQN